MQFFLSLLISGLVFGSIYALVALGFVLIYKATGIINFAQGEMVMFGAYICIGLATNMGLPLLVAIPLAMVGSALLGLLLERVIMRPMIGQEVVPIIIITIGIGFMIRAVIMFIWGVDTLPFPQLLSEEPITFMNVPIAPTYIWSIIVCAAILIVFSLMFKFTPTGIAMRATANDQQAAQSMGVSVKWVFAMAWAIGGVVAALGGVLLGNINGVNAYLSVIGLKVFPVVIVGGLDSIPGAILGGLIVGVAENLCGGYLDPIFGGGVKAVAPFVILLIILLVRPYGLFGSRQIERV
ncbi:MAG: branched-chain amino acid ABC transporter permease [Candidatus Tectomicrobia bacterium]